MGVTVDFFMRTHSSHTEELKKLLAFFNIKQKNQ